MRYQGFGLHHMGLGAGDGTQPVILLFLPSSSSAGLSWCVPSRIEEFHSSALLILSPMCKRSFAVLGSSV